MSITFHCPDASDKELDRIGCNFANGNALDLLHLIGHFDEGDPYCGVWKPQDLPTIQRSIMRALNTDNQREYLIRPPQADSRIIYQGNTDEQTIHRLEALQTLVAYAAKNNYDIVYC